jgi:hypothetical protein
MSYGYNLTEGYRLIGIQAAQILKGEKPADMPDGDDMPDPRHRRPVGMTRQARGVGCGAGQWSPCLSSFKKRQVDHL